MTIDEMHYALEAGLQKLASFAYDGFLPEEKDYYLNLAQVRYVKERLFIQDERGGFATSLKHLEDVRTLIQPLHTSSPREVEDDYFVDFPADYNYYIQGKAKLSLVGFESQSAWKQLTLLANDRSYELLQSPFGQSTFNFPKGAIYGNALKIYAGKKSILREVSFDYVKKAQIVDLALSKDCELPVHTHPEIVALAVQIIKEVIEIPSYVTSVQENKSQP